MLGAAAVCKQQIMNGATHGVLNHRILSKLFIHFNHAKYFHKYFATELNTVCVCAVIQSASLALLVADAPFSLV